MLRAVIGAGAIFAVALLVVGGGVFGYDVVKEREAERQESLEEESLDELFPDHDNP